MCDLQYPEQMPDISDDRSSSACIKTNGMNADTDPQQRAWMEVSPSAVEHNTRAVKGLLALDCSLMAVVKADGYGHGAETVARAAICGGASSLGVATLQEGIELRRAGLEQPVLVLGNLTQPEELRACLHWQLMPTLSSIREAALCNRIRLLQSETNRVPGGQACLRTPAHDRPRKCVSS